MTNDEKVLLVNLFTKRMDVIIDKQEHVFGFNAVHELILTMESPAFNLANVVGQSEQLVCDCLMPSIVGTPTNDKCIGCGKPFEAN